MVCFCIKKPSQYIAIVCYVLLAYLLTVDVIWFIRTYKERIKPSVLNFINNNKYVSRYFKDLAFKTVISLYKSLILNLIYVFIHIINSINHKSLWSVTLAAYYFILTMMRFLLLKGTTTNKLGKSIGLELKKYQNCGYALLFMNFVLTGIVVLAIDHNEGFYYEGYLIYVMAMYAFYNVILAITSIIKYKKIGSPIIAASNIINFSSALISILSLEMAILTSFDTSGDIILRNRFIGITGFVICLIFIALSFYMIIHSRRQLKKL